MSQAEKDAYWSIWKHFPFNVLVKALEAYMGSDQADFFPKAASVVPHADRIWHARSLNRSAELRLEEQGGGFQQIQDATTDEVGKASLALIYTLMNDKITKAAYVDGLRRLHTRWPALGFDHAANTVEGRG